MAITKIPGKLIDSTSNFTFANVSVTGNISSGHILPSANVTYDLGSPSLRFRSLYIAGNTINIGGATISATANSISLTSPTGAIFSVSGTSALDTVGSFGSLAVTGNITSGAVYTDSYFYSNGTSYYNTGPVGATGISGSAGLGYTAQSVGQSFATTGALIGTNTYWYVLDIGAYAVGNFVNLVDNTSGSTYYYFGRITLIQFAGGFGWAIHADIISDGGTPNGDPSSSWTMELTGATGPQGIQGNVGASGSNGTIGIDGATGPVGATGVFSGTTTQQIETSNTTISTSITTGALVVSGGAGIAGNVFAGSVYSSSYFYSNGTPYSSGGGSGTSTSSSTVPTSPGIGDIWYNTTTDVLYRYTNDGVSSYWLDITGPTYGGSVVSSGGSAATYAEATGNITLAVNTKYIVDTSAARTLTLPATPTLGQEIGIIDGTGTCATYNITISRNSSNIQGLAEDLTINSNRAAFTLVYYNVANGWVLTNV